MCHIDKHSVLLTGRHSRRSFARKIRREDENTTAIPRPIVTHSGTERNSKSIENYRYCRRCDFRDIEAVEATPAQMNSRNSLVPGVLVTLRRLLKIGGQRRGRDAY